MFDISFTELLLVVVLATVFIGPKEFPTVIKAVARGFYHIKKLWYDIKGAMNDIAREAGVDDIKRELEHEYQHDVQMIQGDDGKFYEAYDIEKILEQAPSKQQGESETIPHVSPYKFPMNKGDTDE